VPGQAPNEDDAMSLEAPTTAPDFNLNADPNPNPSPFSLQANVTAGLVLHRTRFMVYKTRLARCRCQRQRNGETGRGRGQFSMEIAALRLGLFGKIIHFDLSMKRLDYLSINYRLWFVCSLVRFGAWSYLWGRQRTRSVRERFPWNHSLPTTHN